MTELKVNFNRLWQDLEELARIGQDPRGGISRPSFSLPDLEARDWLKGKIEASGLALRQDSAGNIFGRLPGKSSQVVMAGSHLDTVINGGRFDGSVGVLSALECLRRLKEENFELDRTLEVASFTDEEGNLVGDFLGSRAFTGQLNEGQLKNVRTQFGPPLIEIVEKAGLKVENIPLAAKERPEILAYLELHIEQGPVLEEEEVPIGLVTAIAGKRYFQSTFVGRSGHAGTIPMELRQDAFISLADFALRANQLVLREYEDDTLTIGRVVLKPGSFSIIPGEANFSLDLRSLDHQKLEEMEGEVLALAREVASTRGLSFYQQLLDSTEPVIISESILNKLKAISEKLGYDYRLISSGAGHDAQIMASICPVGMIFIPSVDGLSHVPEEKINPSDLEKGANLLLRTLLDLASV
ncbi:MAG TPA: M20 family metallo-hydrolase [Candidatus Saccharicenans sp.]|jgi:hydantoinase/carbamoylase family amidase|nr:M20 family metallo-hydrolase [Candidatus Saccharicenans sp.]HRD02004.1 M20 family metallo-hydrolase [Candidatus Saccharicenans sp.]